MAHLLGGATAPSTPCHLVGPGTALSRSNGGISQDLRPVSGRTRISDGNAAGLHFHDDVAVLPDLEGRRDVLHRDAADDRHRPACDSSTAAAGAIPPADVSNT